MTELGQLLSEHKENAKATGSTLLIGFICFGLTIPMTVLFLQEKSLSFNKILFGLCGIFSLIGGIGCVQSFLKNRGGSVEIYENGLIANKGGKKHVALWEEIAVVKESIEKMYMKGSYIYDRYLYTIEKKNGETFELSNMVSDIDQIGQTIKVKTLGILYPQAKEKINKGEQVLFDSLFVDKNGLSGIPWAELSALRVKEGTIEVVDKRGKSLVKGSYAATPNAHLLVKLLEEKLLVDR
ncbi:MAG: hypothetical protein K1X72_17020 [Pyrinomonadaceae bacterium]|nr:hypothetical protein [Pyrinomonadaceae bacterium]